MHVGLISQSTAEFIGSSYLTVGVVVAATQAESVVNALQPALRTVHSKEMPQPCSSTTWVWLNNRSLTCKAGYVGEPCNCVEQELYGPELDLRDRLNASACNGSTEAYALDLFGDNLGVSFSGTANLYRVARENAQEAIDRVKSGGMTEPCAYLYDGIEDPPPEDPEERSASHPAQSSPRQTAPQRRRSRSQPGTRSSAIKATAPPGLVPPL